ncbi:MAG: hypothetical protein JWQ25_2307, partial [Daejeonella sp.]|nr:hypothetical protein [Daejeonella sp.]
MRYIIIFVLTIFSFNGFAQKLKFEKTIGWKDGQFRPIALKRFSNKDKTLTCITLQKADSLRAYVFNEKLEVLKEIKLPRSPDEEVLGGFFTIDKVSIISKNKYTQQFHILIYRLKGTMSTEHLLDLDIKGKRLIGAINAGDHFYYVTSEKKTLSINVADFKTDGGLSTINFGFNDLKKPKTDRSTTMFKPEKAGINAGFSQEWLPLFSKAINGSVIEEGLQTDINSANSPNKIYLRNDSLLLLMDANEGITSIYSFNLKDKTAAYRALVRKFPESKSVNGTANPFITFNSFLVDSTLYYIHATSNKLTLQINNFYTGALKIKYDTESNNSVEFKNTPIYQESEDSFYGSNHSDLNTKQLLRKMVNGNAVISGITNARNQHEITIGAYIERKGGGGMVISGGITAAGFGQRMYMPDRSWKRLTRFQALFDPTTANHIGGIVEPNGAELADQYAEDVTIPDEGSDTFVINQGFYYTYYNS